MSGEKAPKSDYRRFHLEDKEVLFVTKEELKTIRKQQARQYYQDNMKIISEDVLRIMVQIGSCKMSPGIPVELCRPHSFPLKDPSQNSRNPTARITYPIVCRIKPIVTNFSCDPTHRTGTNAWSLSQP